MKTVREVIGNDDIALQLCHGFISCDDIPELYENLFTYYAFERCEMPYGTMKARDGDPINWINNKAAEELEDDAALRLMPGW